jgi:hypothetical protein
MFLLKFRHLSFFVILIFSSCCISAKVKKAEEVFGTWIHHQQMLDSVPVDSFMDSFDDYVKLVGDRYKSEQEWLDVVSSVFSFLGEQKSANKNQFFAGPVDPMARWRYAKLYDSLERNIPEFMTMLIGMGFSDESIDKQDEALKEKYGKWEPVVNKYKFFMRLLFACQQDSQTDQYLWNVADRMFRFCFGEKSFKDFQTCLEDKRFFPINRLLYSTIWWNLVGTGWQTWHKKSLEKMKRFADSGKEIQYLAGGSDLYKLLENGVYNINVVDPQLPTQDPYYSKGWEFLIQGEDDTDGIGDEILLDFETKKLKMVRNKVEKGDFFSVPMPDGSPRNIRYSKTFWSVVQPCDLEKPGEIFSLKYLKYLWNNLFGRDQRLGTIKMDRRLCRQSDLKNDPKHEILLSFNEMYQISSGNWGIDARGFDNDLTVHIKQMENPVDKTEMCNVRDAFMKEFRFIQLGSCSV